MKDILILLQNALSYGGDMLLSFINYLMLFLVVLSFVRSELRVKVRLWWLVLLVAFLLQASLWFVLGVQGISIIWNTLLGFLIFCLFRLKSKLQISSKVIIYFSMVITVSANLYFALIFPLITSVAHIAALILGMSFYLLIKVNNLSLSDEKYK